MISSLLTAMVEGYAALDRSTDRRAMLNAATVRANQSGRSIIPIRSVKDIAGLQSVPSNSATVFVDCSLEKFDSEADLIAGWNEIKRVAGATDDDMHDVYVLCIQPWSRARLAFDPRVRWVIVKAPPFGKLDYRAFGRRTTILADTRVARRPKPANPIG